MASTRPVGPITLLGLLLALAACAASTFDEGARRVGREEAAAAAGASKGAASDPVAAIEPATGDQDCSALRTPAHWSEGAWPHIQPLDDEAAASLLLDREPPRATRSDCVLLVGGVQDLAVRMEALGLRTLAASRVIGVRRRTNPAWLELERELRKAKQDAEREQRPRILRTGEPSVDLIGLAATAVIETLNALTRKPDRVAELEAQLAATPRIVDEEVLAPLTLAVEQYRIEKRGRMRLALFELGRSRAWRITLPVQEVRTFALLPAGAPTDLRLPQEPELYVVRERQAIDAWRREPLRVPLSQLVPAIAEALKDEPQSATLAALEAEWRADKAAPSSLASDGLQRERAAASLQPAFSASVVVIRDASDEPAAYGFYVAPEHVLTLARTLPRTSLVPVEVAAGLTTYGLVESRDDARDLALIWLPRPGQPLALSHALEAAEAARLRPLYPPFKEQMALPGTPLAFEGAVAALARVAGGADPIPALVLRRFLLHARAEQGVALPDASFGD